MNSITDLSPEFQVSISRTGDDRNHLKYSVHCYIDADDLDELGIEYPENDLSVVEIPGSVCIGKLSAIIFCDIYNHKPHGGSIGGFFQAADAVDGDHMDAVGALINENSQYKIMANPGGAVLMPEISAIVKNKKKLPKGVASINSIEVLSDLRGLGAGSLLVKEFAMVSRHLYDVAVLSPIPLKEYDPQSSQYIKNYNVGDYDRLRRFYHNLGFQEFTTPGGNVFASASDLGVVQYDYTDDPKVHKAALMMAVKSAIHGESDGFKAESLRISDNDNPLLVASQLDKLRLIAAYRNPTKLRELVMGTNSCLSLDDFVKNSQYFEFDYNNDATPEDIHHSKSNLTAAL